MLWCLCGQQSTVVSYVSWLPMIHSSFVSLASMARSPLLNAGNHGSHSLPRPSWTLKCCSFCNLTPGKQLAKTISWAEETDTGLPVDIIRVGGIKLRQARPGYQVLPDTGGMVTPNIGVEWTSKTGHQRMVLGRNQIDCGNLSLVQYQHSVEGGYNMGQFSSQILTIDTP